MIPEYVTEDQIPQLRAIDGIYLGDGRPMRDGFTLSGGYPVVKKAGPPVLMSYETLADFNPAYEAEYRLRYGLSDACPWPRMDPVPRYTRAVAWVKDWHLRFREAWAVLRGEEADCGC